MSLLSRDDEVIGGFPRTNIFCRLKITNEANGKSIELRPSFLQTRGSSPGSHEHDGYGVVGFELSEYFVLDKITIIGEQRRFHNHSPKTVRFFRVSNPSKSLLRDQASSLKLDNDRDVNIPRFADIEKRFFTKSAGSELGRYGVFLWKNGWDHEYIDFSASATGRFIADRSEASEQESVKLQSAVVEALDEADMIPDLINIVIGYCDFMSDVKWTNVFQPLHSIA